MMAKGNTLMKKEEGNAVQRAFFFSLQSTGCELTEMSAIDI